MDRSLWSTQKSISYSTIRLLFTTGYRGYALMSFSHWNVPPQSEWVAKHPTTLLPLVGGNGETVKCATALSHFRCISVYSNEIFCCYRLNIMLITLPGFEKSFLYTQALISYQTTRPQLLIFCTNDSNKRVLYASKSWKYSNCSSLIIVSALQW